MTAVTLTLPDPENLAQILTCDVFTVRRDIQTLRDKQGVHTGTRG